MGQSMQGDLPSIEAAAEGLWNSKNGLDYLGFNRTCYGEPYPMQKNIHGGRRLP
jgi:hypothetical protein